MTYLIAALFVLSVFHFVYEMIVAPSLRMSVRHKLFALRDELRRLKMTTDRQLDDRHFRCLQDSLNVLIQALDIVSLSLVVRLHSLSETDASFRERVENRSRILDDCKVPEALDIRKQSLRLALEALAINCAGGIVYFLPLFLIMSGYSRAKHFALALASMPASDLQSIEPGRARSAVAHP